MDLPRPEHGLQLRSPPQTCCGGLPLGNGLLTAFVWGDGHPLRIAVGRSDWPDGSDSGTSCAAQILLSLADAEYRYASLPLDSAIAAVNFTQSAAVRVMVHAAEPLGMILVRANTPVTPRLETSAAPGEVTARSAAGPGFQSVFFAAPPGSALAVFLGWKNTGRGLLAAWTLVSARESERPWQSAEERVRAALAQGFQKFSASHRGWWHAFWHRACASAAGDILDRQWYMKHYKRGISSQGGGSASR